MGPVITTVMNCLSTTAAFMSPGLSEEESLASLFGKYQARLLRLAYRITGNHADAEDAVQETFFRLSTRLNQFRGQSQFSTWVTRIAINQALTCLRQRRRDNALSLDECMAGDDERPQIELRDCRPMPDAAAFAGESRAQLEQCIMRLPKIYREIVLLYYVDELSIAEVKATLQLTEPTTKSRLVRARRMLRERLKEAR